MILTALSFMLTFGQVQERDAGPPSRRPDPVVVHDMGPPLPPRDLNVRHAMAPGTIEPQLKPIDGFLCTLFVGYAETQTVFNILQGDRSCSGEIMDQRSGSFRQVNYLPTTAGSLPVVIHSPRDGVDAKSRLVIFITGGPRNVSVTRPLVEQMVAKGYTVLMPIYLGAIETRHPAPDLPGAIEQVQALAHWAGNRLEGTVGVSAGAYLAAAACTGRCGPRVLLAPPLTTPEDVFSDKRVDWSKVHKGYCLWRPNGPERICADNELMVKSFWGANYYRRSLADLLKGQCDRVKIIVSTDDKRVYDARGVADLRAIGCRVDTPAGYEHWQTDGDKALNDQTIDFIAQRAAEQATGQRSGLRR